MKNQMIRLEAVNREINRFLTKTVLTLLICNLFAINVWSQCMKTAEVPPNGTATVSSVLVTNTSTGSVSQYFGTWTDCGLYTTTSNNLHVGQNGTWSTTFNFDIPQNNLVFVITAAGSQTLNENFIFTTNLGAATVTDLGSCCTNIISNEVLIGTCGPGGGLSGGGEFSISAATPYSQVTITGSGGENGALLGICEASFTSCILPVQITGTDPACNASDGSATATPSGGTSPYVYSWSNGQTGATATGLTVGTYTVTVTDADGCPGTQQVTMNSTCPPCTKTAEIPLNGTATVGSVNITNTSTGSVSQYFGSWTDCGFYTTTPNNLHVGQNGTWSTTFNFDIPQNNLVFVITAAGSQTLNENFIFTTNLGAATVTDLGSCCTNIISNEVLIGTCGPGGGLSGGGEFSISAATPYSQVTITGSGGENGALLGICEATFPAPTCALQTNVTGSNIMCDGGVGSATVSTTGGASPVTYNWNNGNTTATATGLSAGMYQVTIVDANGCSEVDTIEITAPMALSAASTATNVSCNGSNDGTATVSASGGTPAYTYTWSNGNATAMATGLAAGTHQVTVVDANGCSTTNSIQITAPSALNTAVTSTNVSCNGSNNGEASVAANGGTAPYSYNWSNGGTSATVSDLPPGSYNVTVTDNNNCAVVGASVLITEPQLLTGIVTSQSLTCAGANDGSATVSVVGGIPPYIYNWSNGFSGPVVTGLASGTYQVAIIDDHGCETVEAVTITSPSAMSISTTVVASVSCNGSNNGAATVSVTGGTPGYTYIWSNGNTTAMTTGLSVGMYSVTVVDQNACSTVDMVQILGYTGSGLIVYIDTDEVSCGEMSDGTATVTPSNGTPPYSYQWDANAGNQTTSTATGLALGTYLITVTDANGCNLVNGVLIEEAPCDYCLEAEINDTDICAIITTNPNHALDSLDCDGDGVTNGDECFDGTSPSDPCFFTVGSITKPVTADQSECLNLCPDLTMVSTLLPSTLVGPSATSLRINITELNGVDAGPSPIKVRMPSDPRLTFAWNAAANPDWVYGGDNGIFHVFTFVGNGGVFTGGSSSPILLGLAETMYDPQGTDGVTTFSPSIVPFSGGECFLNNNTDPETLVYFR